MNLPEFEIIPNTQVMQNYNNLDYIHHLVTSFNEQTQHEIIREPYVDEIINYSYLSPNATLIYANNFNLLNHSIIPQQNFHDSFNDLNKFDKFMFHSQNNTNQIFCSICLDVPNSINFEKCQLSCTHTYHKNCIRKWFKINLSCPCCRKIPVANILT